MYFILLGLCLLLLYIQCPNCDVAHAQSSLISAGTMLFTLQQDNSIKRPFQCTHALIEEFLNVKVDNVDNFLPCFLDSKLSFRHVKGSVTKIGKADDDNDEGNDANDEGNNANESHDTD